MMGVLIALDLKLFDISSRNESPPTIQLLAQETGADPVLLLRLLCFLASIQVVAESDKETFVSSNAT